MRHPDRYKFTQAAQAEYEGLQAREAWTQINLEDVPEGSQIFPIKWVFVTKKDGDGNIIKHKAHIVVRGDLNKKAYNRDEIYSHTLGLQHFRSLTTYISFEDMETLSFDAVQAFVNAKRDRPIYCYMLEYFRQNNKILRVEKALYGRRQSPKDWFDCYTKELKKLNLNQ